MKAHFEMMAAYNAWANRRLYDAVGALPEADRKADLGAFFKSLHGTLNHLLVADTVWMARFRDRPNPPLTLDQVLHKEHDAIRAAREEMDADIVAFFGALPAEDYAKDFTYRNMAGEPFTQPRGPAFAHFFNHQTHHRGQCHAMLTRLGAEAPPLDLIYHLRNA